MKKKFWVIVIAAALIALLLANQISDKKDSKDQNSKRQKRSYYSLVEIAQMRVSDSKNNVANTDSPTLSESEKMDLLESNDICEILKKFPSIKNEVNSRNPDLDTLFRLRSPVSENPEDVKLISPVFRGPFTGDQNFVDVLPAVKFFNALLLANMVAGVKSEYVDTREAIKALEQLENEDSSNAAYPLFRAAILHKTGASAADIHLALMTAFSLPHFDTFERRIAEAIYRQSFASVAAFFYAEPIISKMPVADWSPILALLREHLGKDSVLDRAALAFAKRLRMRGERVDGEFDFVLWSSLEYAFADVFEKYAWKSAYPNLPQPKPKSWRDLIKKHEGLRGLEEQMENILQKKTPCDPVVFQNIYNYHLKEFEKSLSKIRQ